MLRIKRDHFNYMGSTMDYELEDRTLLHESEWNGEYYTVKKKGKEEGYKPVLKGIGEQYEDGVYDQYEVIGFEKLVLLT
jgi:hypothetical protein